VLTDSRVDEIVQFGAGGSRKKKRNRVFDRELPKTFNKKRTVLMAAGRKTRTMLMVADGKNRWQSEGWLTAVNDFGHFLQNDNTMYTKL